MAPQKFHGAAARELRKRSGVRRTDMARALGCTPRWVSRIESGTGRPSIESIALYAQRLQVSLDSLLVPAAPEPVLTETEEAA